MRCQNTFQKQSLPARALPLTRFGQVLYPTIAPVAAQKGPKGPQGPKAFFGPQYRSKPGYVGPIKPCSVYKSTPSAKLPLPRAILDGIGIRKVLCMLATLKNFRIVLCLLRVGVSMPCGPVSSGKDALSHRRI